MKTKTLTILICLFNIWGCTKKDNSSNSNNNSNNSNNTNNINTNNYVSWVSYTDTTEKIFEMLNEPAGYYTMCGSFGNYAIDSTDNYSMSYSSKNGFGNVIIVLPVDSSNLIHISLGKKMLLGINVGAGCFSQVMEHFSINFSSSKSGTDLFVEQTDTLNYYNKVISLIYSGREYNTVFRRMDAIYIIQGEFKALIHNDLTSSNRIWSNGKYKLKITCNAI